MLGEDGVRAAYARHETQLSISAIASLGGVAVAARQAKIDLASGGTLVDLSSGGFGYSHPLVLDRVGRQLTDLPLSNRMFLSRPLAELIDRLAAIAPGKLSVSYPTNSGAEAVDCALKLMKGYHRRRDTIVAIGGSYHGSNTAAAAVSGIASQIRKRPAAPLNVVHVSFGDFALMRRMIDERTAGVLLEPAVTSPGVQFAQPHYLRAVQERCREVGALLAVDEVATGLGRLGTRFAVEREGVEPDMLVLGNALGGGVLPIAVCLSTRAVNDRVYGRRHPALHGSTTGGNPAACVAAVAVLDVIEKEEIPERCAQLGQVLAHELSRLSVGHSQYWSDVCQRGLLGSVRMPSYAQARELQKRAWAAGALVRAEAGADGAGYIGLRPPLIITETELRRGLEALDVACQQLGGSKVNALDMSA